MSTALGIALALTAAVFMATAIVNAHRADKAREQVADLLAQREHLMRELRSAAGDLRLMHDQLQLTQRDVVRYREVSLELENRTFVYTVEEQMAMEGRHIPTPHPWARPVKPHGLDTLDALDLAL